MEHILTKNQCEALTPLFDIYEALAMPLLTLVGDEMYSVFNTFQASRLSRATDDYYNRYYDTATAATVQKCLAILLSEKRKVHNPITDETCYHVIFTSEQEYVLKQFLEATANVAMDLMTTLEPHAESLNNQLTEMRDEI